MRTTNATRGKRRAAEDRRATMLRERGWICVPPTESALIDPEPDPAGSALTRFQRRIIDALRA